MVQLPDKHCGKSKGPSLCVVAATRPHPLSPQLQGPWWVEARVRGGTRVPLPSLPWAGGWEGGVEGQVERERGQGVGEVGREE